ncbi:uncharacterized protein BO66DRAFT_467184 [Aspergillus aculeatinus CBS 121060]|uniref:Uncharacterized protein n=1 Tax=Aspergillus aculeatinus CBS 121060 TaxID=1448322 RepID=A0ACD1HQ08_9EURO|nr:hypothetical protein BO66DRAFT_467184 [Aspergillus aculeatinus CBS 121060]RAH75492.1 hypothetical protein BO66DRAFT_467184 [Aspergillus aculeatinus CBS 121060]
MAKLTRPCPACSAEVSEYDGGGGPDLGAAVGALPQLAPALALTNPRSPAWTPSGGLCEISCACMMQCNPTSDPSGVRTYDDRHAKREQTSITTIQWHIQELAESWMASEVDKGSPMHVCGSSELLSGSGRSHLSRSHSVGLETEVDGDPEVLANEPIAVIGSGCRFPGTANSPSNLWELLRQPRDLLREIPTERFNAKAFHHPDPQYHGHSNVLHSYLLDEDVRRFDPQFFNIKPVEAQAMDPQQRLLLETVYEGLEAAGLTIEGLRGSRASVYAGLMCNDYEAILLRDFQQIPNYHATGVARSIVSNRISYFFDWHGPSLTVDTACSSSLIAVHLAVQALRAAETNVAFVCGSNLILGPENYVAESKLKMLSPDGRSRMWDQSANGYARGEGVAVVVLKTLSAALADGDHIECLIRETGINQDGRTQGITMPSAIAQASLIRDTYARAGLDPRQEGDRCQYFEAHGTGTPAGDPIEAEAINEAFFGQYTVSGTQASTPLYVGSIKTVIGHTEGTAGLAALLKASLALQHGVIPPNLLFQHLNPRITPFYDAVEVPTQAIAWPETSPGSPRRASVNSFGFGGSNAHAILESYQQPERLTGTPPVSQVFSQFVFSAHSTQSLVGNLREYSRFLETNPTISAQDLAWTLRARRSSFPAKVSFPASSIQSLKANIDGWLTTEAQSAGGTIGARMTVSSSTNRPRLLVIFTGQGAQYARMGAELIERSPYAAAILARLEGRLSQLPISDRPPWSLRQELLAKAASSRVHEALISQPLCTAVQILLVDLLRLAGVQFSTVVGHSSGEIGAAYAAGYLSADDAICIAYYRGLHSKLARGPEQGIEGAMLAVGTSLENAQELLSMEEFSGRVTVAACNSSSSVTLSGDKDAIEELEAILEDEGKFRRRLKVDKAYRSHHMQMCSGAYLQSLRGCNIRPQQPSADCVWLSSVYEDPAVDLSSTLHGPYWDENMVSPVLFSQAVKRAFASGPYDAVIEVGPHPALKGPATQTAQEAGFEEVLYTRLLTRGKESIGGLSNALGLLWVHLGASGIDIDGFERGLSGGRDYQMVLNLPSYQWQHDRASWHESRISRGHQLQSRTVFPAAGYVATALEAVRYFISEQDIRLITILDFIIHQAMVFDDEDAGIEVITCLDDVRSEEEPKRVRARFTYSAAVGKERDRLTLVASGEVEILLGEPSPDILPSRGPSEPNMIEVETDRFYHALEDLGYGYQGPFRALSALKRKLGRATGLVARTPTDPTKAGFLSLHVPTRVRSVCVDPALCGRHWAHVDDLPFESSLVDHEGPGITCDVDIYNADNARVALQIETESNTQEGQKEEPPSSPAPGEIPGEDSPALVSYSDSIDHLSQAESSSPEEGHLTPISSVIDEPAKSTPNPRPIAAIQQSGRLSSTQSMFWFVHALMEDKTTLNHTAMFRLSGPLDVDRLREAVTAVAQRHEALRTCLVMDARQHITQAVLETSVLRLELRQIHADDEVMAEYEALKQHVYDLTSGETMRIVLLSGSPGHYHLLIGCHHINVDGISYQVLMADLECAYKGEPRDTPVLQYLDYADRQREQHEQGAWDQEIAFWKRELGPIPSPLPPGRHLLAHRQPLHHYGVHSVKLRIDTALANRIREVVRTCKATAFHFYLAAFRALLHRYLNAQDVCIGIADGNRSGTGMLDSIGPYVNLLPLRFVARDGQSFQEALVEVKSRTYAALAHSQLPFEVLLNELRVARSPTHSPLFQAFVDYRQGTRERQPFGDLQLEMLHFEPGRTAYDVSLDIIDNPGQDALVVVMAQRNLYSLGDAEVMAQIYEDILQEYSSIPSMAADKNWSFRPETLQKALDHEGPVFQPQWSRTLIHQFETQRHLHKTALHVANASAWSYEELGQRVDRIARELISCGAQPSDKVAVLQDRTADPIASMLATMKIGAVYVPLDPNVPLARLAKIVRDCDPVALLADSTTVTEGGSLAQPSAAVMIDVSELAAYSSGSSLPNHAEPDATALILYTSGTTGTPEGVALPHSSFCHEVEVSVSTYGLTQDDHILQQSAVSFDMSVLQVFLALAQGATLCMTSAAMRADPSAISAFITQAGVTFTCATPSEYQSWLQSGHRRESLRLSAWRTALTGGEPATTALLHSFRDLGRPELRLYNGYGPTETTCCSTKMELSYQNAFLYAECVPAGRPSANEAIYIVDQAMRLQPVGQPGEILIGGVGVASADVFASPKDRQQGWTTMYRTKDYGHLRPDGSLIIEGRVDADTEIKLHGVRTDLMDIEKSILQAAEGTLCNVAVSVRSAAEKTFLVAHCAFSPTVYQSTAEQEQSLQALLPQLPLPQGMCPSALVTIDQMPLTSAGKLDRHALAHLSLPASAESRREATATSTLSDAETEMKGLWEEVIPEELWSHHRVDSQTDFFHVGGSSMLLVDLRALISNRIGTSIPLIRLFESSTLKGMALLIARTTPGDTTVGVLDWKTETSLTPDLARIVGPPLPSTSLLRCPPRVIVLTGASGFLGQHLLRHLLAQQQPVVDQVICIAVRQLADRAHLFAGMDRQRVVCYEGDLAAPRLGLKEDDAQRIFGTADAVIHNGADVSHLKNYHTLKGANVQSTQELVRLCLPRGIPLHYISTAGVAMFTTREAFAEVSAGDAQPPSDGSDGYTATKWVSELYLEQASQTFQLPVWIHRPSSVVRQERAGAAEAIDQDQDNVDARPMFDLLQNLLRYSRHLKAVPVSTNLKGSLDLVSVQNVARGVVKAVVAQSIDQREVAYSHLTGDFELPIDGLKEYLEGETGEAFAMLPIREWARRAEGAGLHRAVATVFSRVDELALPLQFPRFGHTNGWKWMHGSEE